MIKRFLIWVDRLVQHSVYGRLRSDAFIKYVKNDVKNTERLYSMLNKMNLYSTPNFTIKNVIFNDPATIVLWSDGTKTVVKCQDGDEYDPEKGLAMAISKKSLGNKRDYYHNFLYWLKRYEKDCITHEQLCKCGEQISKGFADGIKQTAKAFEHLGKTIKDMNRKNAVRKAYDAAIKLRDTSDGVALADINAIIGYLGEALED